MYKVFFENRVLILTNKTDEQNDKAVYYTNIENFKEFINQFENDKNNQQTTIIHQDIDVLYAEFIKHFTVIYAAGGVIKNNENQLLIIKRHCKWDLPKGKQEKDENIEECALREVKEECGLQHIKLQKLLTKTYHTYRRKDKRVFKITYWYSMIHTAKERPVPQIIEDITEVKWIEKTDLQNIKANTYKSLIDVFQKAF